MQYNQSPMGNQPYYPMPPEPEKKKNTGLVIGIIVLAVAIVLVSVLGTCFYVKRSGDLRMEKIVRALETDHVQAAQALYEDAGKLFRSNRRDDVAAALVRRIIAAPYKDYNDGEMVLLGEEDIARYVQYEAFGYAISLEEYNPYAMDYIRAVCALEPYVQYNEVRRLIYTYGETYSLALNASMDGLSYLGSGSVASASRTLKESVSYYDIVLDGIAAGDMQATFVSDYYDDVELLRDSMVQIYQALDRRDYDAVFEVMDGIPDYDSILEDVNIIVDEADVLRDDVDAAWEDLMQSRMQ